MKHVILNADGDRVLYLVPDIVADNLETYCLGFAHHWLHHSPHAEKYRIRGGLCYSEGDFIDYLNQYVFPEEKSVMVRVLGCMNPDNFQEEYRGVPYFKFLMRQTGEVCIFSAYCIHAVHLYTKLCSV